MLFLFIHLVISVHVFSVKSTAIFIGTSYFT
jgi:hypothetical protein